MESLQASDSVLPDQCDRVNLIGHCPFCFRLLETENNDSEHDKVSRSNKDSLSSSYFTRVWSHLFGKFHCCCVYHDEREKGKCQLSPGIPKFAFANKLTGDSICAGSVPPVCNSCYETVREIDRLDHELAQVRRNLHTQFNTLRNVVSGAYSDRFQFEKLLQKESNLSIEEKQTTLQFLGYLKKVTATNEQIKAEPSSTCSFSLLSDDEQDIVDNNSSLMIKSEPSSEGESWAESESGESICDNNDYANNDPDFSCDEDEEELIAMQSLDTEVNNENTFTQVDSPSERNDKKSASSKTNENIEQSTNSPATSIQKVSKNLGTVPSLRCKTCSKTFQSGKGLYWHEKTKHPGVKPDRLRRLVDFKCKECGKAFHSKKYLDQHHRTNHTEEGPVKCYKCTKTFFTELGRKTHIETIHEGGQRYACDLCGKDFPYNNNLKRHKREVHKQETGKKARSETRKKKAPLDSSVDRIKTQTNRDKFQNGAPLHCKTCAKPFYSSKSLYAHERSKHPGIKPDRLKRIIEFDCKECGKSFHSKHYLDQHIRTNHSKEGFFKCLIDKCSKSFQTPLGRKVHMESKHAGRRFACDMCDKDFAYSHNVVKHKRQVHFGEKMKKNYVCDVEACGESFITSSSLKTHKMRVHDESAACPQCSETFKHKMLLTLHIKKVHGYEAAGVNAYTCEDCGDVFNNSRSLSGHRYKKHNPDLESLTCEHCGKECRHLDSLKSHIKTVHNRSNFICEVCGAGYGSKSSMDYHTNVTHKGIKPFECHLCPYKFYRKCDLEDHLKVHAKGRKPRSQVKKDEC